MIVAGWKLYRRKPMVAPATTAATAAVSGVAERRREDREGHRRDRAEAGGQAVHPVDEVHDVGDRDDPEDGDRIRRWAQVVDADERQRHVVDRDVPARERDGDGGDRDLAGELGAGRDRDDVVDGAERAHERGAEHDAPEAVLRAERGARDGDAGEDRDAAEPWERPRVHAAVAVRAVEDARPRRCERDDGREQHDEQESDCKPDGSCLVIEQ